MRVKVIISNGVTTDVLADGPVEVEVVDIDTDYEDYDQLQTYKEELYRDESLKSVEYSAARFDVEGGE